MTTLVLKPGSTTLPISISCSINETDIRLLNPTGSTSISSQKLNFDSISLFKFQSLLRLDKMVINHLQPSSISGRLTKLERNNQPISIINKHLIKHSTAYISTIMILLLISFTAIPLLYYNIHLWTLKVNSIHHFIRSSFHTAKKRTNNKEPTNV